MIKLAREEAARIAGVAVFALAACATPPAPAPAAPTPPAAPPSGDSAPAPSASTSSAGGARAGVAGSDAPPADTSGTPHERLMRSHFREAALIRTAVIDGKLANVVVPAEALANTEGLGKIEPAWQSSIDVLRYAARRMQHASDIPGAAAAIADIGIACGACHNAAGGPHTKLDAPPASDGSLESRMRRHVWATDRLWEGIFGPSDASWKAGAEALSGEPFPKEVLERGGVHAKSEAARFMSIVATIGPKKTPQDRGQAYASLLETCSACHVVTRK
jgi:hypothetical protein